MKIGSSISELILHKTTKVIGGLPSPLLASSTTKRKTKQLKLVTCASIMDAISHVFGLINH